MKFLNLIFTPDEVRMNSTKVKQIKNWPKPTNDRDVSVIQKFIGFVNFFRKFIKRFGSITASLYNLFKKNSANIWTEICDEVFQKFKNAIATKSIMCHFRANQKTFVETNFLDEVSGKVLSQKNENKIFRLVAFFSKSLELAEKNYAIYDKKMLVIIKCFEK